MNIFWLPSSAYGHIRYLRQRKELRHSGPSLVFFPSSSCMRIHRSHRSHICSDDSDQMPAIGNLNDKIYTMLSVYFDSHLYSCFSSCMGYVDTGFRKPKLTSFRWFYCRHRIRTTLHPPLAVYCRKNAEHRGNKDNIHGLRRVAINSAEIK